jgi:hypothetical protein
VPIGESKDRSVWRLEFFHAGTSVPNVIEQSCTISRPYTVGEIRL